MSESTFTLRVPAEEPFRGLACAAGARLLESRGGSKPECEAFERALRDAAAELVDGIDHLDATLVSGPDGIDVTFTAGGQRRTVHHSRA